METILKLPLDLPQLPPFRNLRELMGDASKALHVWFILWQELIYRIEDGGEPGVFPVTERSLMEKAFEPVAGASPESVAGFFDALLSSKLIQQDGERYVCPRFQVLHSKASHTPSSLARLGGSMKNFDKRMKDVGVKAFQQALSISEHKFKDEAGEPLDPDMTRRVTRVIIACDNALFKGERVPMGFTEGLIGDALKVAKRYTDEEINYILRTVALHRDHPAVRGLNTEKLLPIFSDIVPKLGGVEV